MESEVSLKPYVILLSIHVDFSLCKDLIVTKIFLTLSRAKYSECRLVDMWLCHCCRFHGHIILFDPYESDDVDVCTVCM